MNGFRIEVAALFLGGTIIMLAVILLLVSIGPLHWRGLPPRRKSLSRGYKDIGGKGRS